MPLSCSCGPGTRWPAVAKLWLSRRTRPRVDCSPERADANWRLTCIRMWEYGTTTMRHMPSGSALIDSHANKRLYPFSAGYCRTLAGRARPWTGVQSGATTAQNLSPRIGDEKCTSRLTLQIAASHQPPRFSSFVSRLALGSLCCYRTHSFAALLPRPRIRLGSHLSEVERWL